MVNDTIADMLTRIRNANTIKKETVDVPFSKINVKIAKILVDNGFVSASKTEGTGINKHIVITLKYDDHGNRIISGIKRISTPGLRIYSEAKDMPKVINGLGIAIVSTSKGVMTDAECRSQNIGGEVLAFVW